MYKAPLQDHAFILHQLLGMEPLAGCPAYADYSAELADAVLAESAKLAENVLAPLNQTGDREGCHLSDDGQVRTPAGFRDAYLQFMQGGWPQLRASIEDGGQGAPLALATAAQETWASANLAFKLCPMLTYGATHALTLCASAHLRARFLPKMVTGEWTGTMVLTEPQAGSDLGLIRTRAVPDGDHHRIFGQKIFITWGEQDFTRNIIHLVLARIEGAPAGVRGISLFVVPKVLVNDDGSLGDRNDVRCTGIEHKLGIHASPTCALSFGEKAGAVGYLVGDANRGLEYMFIMMNAARLGVGLQGYAVAERAFQLAVDHARNRLQGSLGKGTGPAAIIEHPDVKRMLLSMKSGIEAMRALTLYTAWQLDLAAEHQDMAVRAAAQARGDLLIPIVKGWCTEFSVELASLGVQVHGGMGFIEDTGAAQLLRDVRITAIYEGTTGIQANDLLGRKLARDQGAAMTALLTEVRAELATPQGRADAEAVRVAAREGIDALGTATAALLQQGATAPEHALAVAVPYLELAGFALGGWLMARAARLAAAGLAGSERDFGETKLATARFYVEQLLPRVFALTRMVQSGGAAVSGLSSALI